VPYSGKTESMIHLQPILIQVIRQDLNSFILTKSSRIVDHTTFDELKWTRDPFPPHFFQLPPGFRLHSHLFTAELIEVLEDIHALQRTREVQFFSKTEARLMPHINNHLASIHSRLAGLSSASPLLECCHLAAYICSSMLCCKVWCALVIPVCELQPCPLVMLTDLATVEDKT
jgi:hypothetical protein